MPFVEVENGISVCYEDWGAGTKYIFTSQIYLDYHAGYARELSKHGYHIIAVQIRGYGRSSRITETDSAMEHWAPDVLKVADHLGVQQFVYTGISHGSGIGWTLLRTHPERILAFAGVVCGPKLKGDHPSTVSWRAKDVSRAVTEDGWKKRCEENRRNILSEIRSFHTPYWKEEICLFAEDDYRMQMALDAKERIMTFGRDIDPLDTEKKLIDWMHTIRVPVIIFGGMQDPIIIP